MGAIVPILPLYTVSLSQNPLSAPENGLPIKLFPCSKSPKALRVRVYYCAKIIFPHPKMANCKRTQLRLSFFQYNTLVTSLVPYQYFIRLHFLRVFLLQCNTIDFSFWHCMMQFIMTIANNSFLLMKPANELARLINKYWACQASLFSDFFSTVFSTTTPYFMEFPCYEVHPDLLMEVLQLDTKSKTFSGTLTLANQLGWMIYLHGFLKSVPRNYNIL